MAVREGWMVSTRLYILSDQNEKHSLQVQIMGEDIQNKMFGQEVQGFAYVFSPLYFFLFCNLKTWN